MFAGGKMMVVVIGEGGETETEGSERMVNLVTELVLTEVKFDGGRMTVVVNGGGVTMVMIVTLLVNVVEVNVTGVEDIVVTRRYQSALAALSISECLPGQ